MIENSKVYQRVSQILKTGTSGYQNENEYNNDAESSFLEILDTLCDNYEINSTVSDLLSKEGLVLTEPITAGSTGLFEFPDEHYRTFPLMVSSDGKMWPVEKLNMNEVAMSETSPIRAFDSAKNIYGYCLTNGKYQMLPREAMSVNITYCILPDMPILELVSDNNDYLTVGPATTDIKLPQNLFNLFCYHMVFRASVEMKEPMTANIAAEYMRIGIKRK